MGSPLPPPVENRVPPVLMGLLIGLALGLRILFGWLVPGHTPDQRQFIEWIDVVGNHGFRFAYLEYPWHLDYPPFFLMVMHYYAKGLALLGVVPQPGGLSFKALPVLIDLAAMVLVIRWSRAIVSVRWRMFVLALFALNPALIADSAIWGQVDMLHSMLMVVTILLLPVQPGLSGMVFAVALLTKFQAVVVLPVIGFWLLRQLIRAGQWRPVAWWLAGWGLMALSAAAYFGARGSLGAMLKRSYFDSVGSYPRVTMAALNIWFHLIGIAPETRDTVEIVAGVTMRQFGLGLLSAAVLFIGAYVLLARGDATRLLLKAATVINFAFFMLPTEIHERYCIPALVFMLFLTALEKRWSIAAVVLTASAAANLSLVLYRLSFPDGLDLIALCVAIAVINVVLLLYMFVELGLEMRTAPSPAQEKPVCGAAVHEAQAVAVQPT